MGDHGGSSDSRPRLGNPSFSVTRVGGGGCQDFSSGVVPALNLYLLPSLVMKQQNQPPLVHDRVHFPRRNSYDDLGQ